MSAGPTQRRNNRRLTIALLVFTAGAFGFGYALVPLYSVLCTITGFGNQKSLTSAVAQPLSQTAADRLVTVDFMSNLPTVGNWEFRPTVASISVQPGRMYEATFWARNLTGHATLAQAVPDLTPSQSAAWFHKTECFCFTPQSFARGEGRLLKVRFFVDRSLPAYLDRLTLSYTLYDVPNKVASR